MTLLYSGKVCVLVTPFGEGSHCYQCMNMCERGWFRFETTSHSMSWELNKWELNFDNTILNNEGGSGSVAERVV